MDNIHNAVFLQCRKTKRPRYVGTLYREPLGKIVAHYDNDYKMNKSQVKVYTVQWYTLKIFGLLEINSHCYKAFTTSYCYYLMIACLKYYK